MKESFISEKMNFNDYLKILLFTVAFQRATVAGHNVQLYTSPKFRGSKTTIEINNYTDCVNLPQDYVNSVQSTNLTNCTQFYDKPNCTGTSIQLSVLSNSKNDLQLWNFHNRTASVGTCQNPCIPDNGQSVPTDATVSIVLYSLPFFQGNSFPIEVKGCTPIKIKLEDALDTYKSIYVPKGKCVLAFLHQWGDDESSIPKDCKVENGQVYEFRDGIPHLYFLTWWPEYTYMLAFRAFSPCHCKSFTDSKMLDILDVSPNENYTVLFSDVEYTGKSHKILHDSISNLEDSCTEVGSEFTNQTVSIFSTNICLRVYDQPKCIGNYILLTQRSPYKYDLRQWRFEKRIQSLQICQDTCIPEETGMLMNLKQTDGIRNPINIKFYLEPYMFQYSLDIVGCTPVDFGEDKIISIQIPDGECVLAFLGDLLDDKDSDSENPCSVEKSHDIFQFWNGLPALDDLSEWHSKRNEYIKAFSPCNCNYVPYPSFSDHLDNSYITLFWEKYFQGKSVNVSLNFTECKDFSKDEELMDWEGFTQSLKMGNESCIRVYKDHDCESSQFLDVNNSVPDLSIQNFGLAIRSMKVCNVIDSNNGNGNNTNEQFKESSSLLSYYLIPIGLIVLVLCTVLAISLEYIRRRVRKIRENMPGRLSESEILEFLEGLRNYDTFVTDSGSDETQNVNEVETTDKSGLEQLSSEVLAQNLPYNSDLEILRTHLEFGNTTTRVRCFGSRYQNRETLFRRSLSTSVVEGSESDDVCWTSFKHCWFDWVLHWKLTCRYVNTKSVMPEVHFLIR
ncbi:unnamed protein product [Orchesella dallaii]|uniref:Uncharacterized protein n=1 Tax=Orchesella dallaii TaxID=48710 RepID=A0ABP1QV92_9HEXA